ncbi:histidinol dehydrogenase [Pseudonocardia sp. ICBG1142]|uniref:histidinol dehydrogenase n=1 Tax=Pseudonocardia sp. ICBG1142 TaxID=2846760 RepID=UPI001CF70C25|nr:histidinol dehydrogenase [Pseudonocardia sp. ICBG1142]
MTPRFCVLDWTDLDECQRIQLLTRGGAAADGEDNPLRAGVRALVADVAERGDAAVVDALAEYDGVSCGPEDLRVSDDEVAAAAGKLPDDLRTAVNTAVDRIRAFNVEAMRRTSWSADVGGTQLGELVRPVASAGLFVPSGKGSFPSVLIQIGTPAVVAGVAKLVLAVPPLPGANGAVDPATLYAASRLGISEIFRVNGPAGIGALAYGTDSIPKVGKIVGPGSPAVQIAQAEVQRSGCVVEVGFGPTDALIISDGTSNVVHLTADLINEAEHGPDSSAVLVSTDADELAAVVNELPVQLARLPEPRKGYAEASIAVNGGLVLAKDQQQAMDIANDYAPEHLQLAVKAPGDWLPLVRHAGTVLMGQWATMSASNFVIGTPATLPTSGYAKTVSGVTVHTFLTRIATAAVNEGAFWELAPHIEALSRHEGFPAHAASVTTRRG